MNCKSCNAPEGSPHGTNCKVHPPGSSEEKPEMEEQRGVATIDSTGAIADMSEGGLRPTNAKELGALAKQAALSSLVPEPFRNKPNDCFVAMAMGREIGFDAFQSLQMFHVVKGKVGLPGEAMVAIIRSREECESLRMGTQGSLEDGNLTGWVVSKRRGQSENDKVTFSLEDAMLAGLYPGKKDRNGEPSVWSKYPKDMLIWKAVARDCRRNWADMTRRVPVAEDMPGYGESRLEINVTPPREETPTADPARALFAGEPIEPEIVGPGPGDPAAPNAEPEDVGDSDDSAAPNTGTPSDDANATGRPAPSEGSSEATPEPGPPNDGPKFSALPEGFDPTRDNCPDCERSADLGHTPGCSIAKLLKEQR